MRYFLSLFVCLAAAVASVVLAACGAATSSEQNKPVLAQPGRVETFGKNSPVITGADNVRIEYGPGQGHVEGPKVLERAPVTAVTHGDNSPVVIANGNAIAITYK